jgi:hypothetical protein
MARPLPCIVSFVGVLVFVCASFAQVVSFNGATSSSSTLSSNTGSSSIASSAPNFNLMSWRSASLTPYGQTTVTSSATSSTTASPPAIPATTNPFVGATLSAQGSLSGGSTVTIVPSAASAAPTAASRSNYSWRAVGYSPTPEPLVTTTNNLTGDYSTSYSTAVNINLPVNLANAGSFAAVPEPGTFAMCVGLAAIVGYGYSRRKQAAQPSEPITEPAKQ